MYASHTDFTYSLRIFFFSVDSHPGRAGRRMMASDRVDFRKNMPAGLELYGATFCGFSFEDSEKYDLYGEFQPN
jgi:hypothetical protein